MMKIIFSNVIYVMLPVLAAITLVSLYLISRLTLENHNFRQYVLQKVETSLSSTLSDINDVSISVILDSSIVQYMSTDSKLGEPEYFRLYASAREALSKLYVQNQFIYDICLLSTDEKTLHCDSAWNVSFSDEELQNMKGSSGGWFWSKTSGQVAIYRLIRNYENHFNHIAYMKVIINPAAFSQTFDHNLVSGIQGYALLDSEGRLITSDLEDYTSVVTDAVANTDFLKSEKHREITFRGKDYYLIPSYSANLKGYLVTLTENPTKSYRDMALVIIFGAMALVICISLTQIQYYRRKLLTPLLKLGELMHSVENENFGVQFNYGASSEIQLLADNFNSMANRLHVLYDEVYANKILLREAEFKRLQSEINPHFLYNSLDCVRWMVELGQKENASKMLEMLSQMFRLSLKKSDGSLVPLEEELTHADTYMGIQQMRLSTRVSYTSDIEEEAKNAYVVKFVLQPILENALTHGLSRSEAPGEIFLNVYRQKDDGSDQLIYYIYDSGTEADEEKIDQILSRKPDERSDTVGLALQNINGRLKIKFGEGYGIFFRKLPEGGSVFVVKQPFITKEDLERYA